MQKRYVVTLTDKERRSLRALVSSGNGSARKLSRARILLKAGAVAAHTCLPVIGVPLASGPLSGFDALLSTVQMPPGMPVATVSVGEAGAKNAALLAIQILARKDARLADAYRTFKSKQAATVAEKNKKLQSKIKGA